MEEGGQCETLHNGREKRVIIEFISFERFLGERLLLFLRGENVCKALLLIISLEKKLIVVKLHI